jgi:nucleoside-diphosphate-sugar epimerase
MKIESVTITGSSGYIGENLIKFLNSQGIFKIYCMDKKEGVRVEEVDVLLNSDVIIHLAAESGIPTCEKNPEEAIRSNISASFNILKLAYENKIPVILASSQAAKNPSSGLYAMTKYAMEIEALRYNALGAQNKILRFSNVFGGIHYFNKKSSVLSCFGKAYLNGEKAKIHGNGCQERDFLFVDDLCKVVFEIAEKIYDIDDEIIDIGTGFPTSIKDIVQYLDMDYEFEYERNGGEECNFADTYVMEKHGLTIPSISKLYEFLNSLIRQKE